MLDILARKKRGRGAHPLYLFSLVIFSHFCLHHPYFLLPLLMGFISYILKGGSSQTQTLLLNVLPALDPLLQAWV
jgi:hypothetical protein